MFSCMKQDKILTPITIFNHNRRGPRHENKSRKKLYEARMSRNKRIHFPVYLHIKAKKNQPIKFWNELAFKLEKAMAPHSSTLAWKIPWTEEPDGLQSMGSLRVGYN